MIANLVAMFVEFWVGDIIIQSFTPTITNEIGLMILVVITAITIVEFLIQIRDWIRSATGM